MGFPVATHVIVYEVDVSSFKIWGDGGKDVIFGSSKMIRYFYTIFVVKRLY